MFYWSLNYEPGTPIDMDAFKEEQDAIYKFRTMMDFIDLWEEVQAVD